jgi:Raf kinase inhibitor-like YbhB/YbcL family protein
LAGASGRSVVAGAGAALLMFLAGCGLIGGPSNVLIAVPDTITVTSPNFNKGVMGPGFSCGSRTHPAIHWSGAPPGTKSLALVMDDSAAPITPYIYWIVFDIGPQSSDIPEGQLLPPGALEADNSKGSVGYDAPCPANRGHYYRFTVYALASKLSLGPGASVKTAWSEIAAAAIARGRLPCVINP